MPADIQNIKRIKDDLCGHRLNSSHLIFIANTSHHVSSVCPPGSIAIIVPLVLLVILIVMVVAGVYICRRRQRYADKTQVLKLNGWRYQIMSSIVDK